MRFLTRPAGIAVLAAGLLAFFSALALLPRFGDRSAPAGARPLRVRTTADAAAAQYLGDRACAECHPRESQDHAASNHAQTLRPMSRERLPSGFPTSGAFLEPVSGLGYTIEESYGRFRMSVQAGGRAQTRELDFALGSGKRAMTFVSLDGPMAIRELRVSYFTNRRKWFVTPGQQGAEADPVGAQHTGPIAQRCFACHATVLPESRLVPEERFMGVGCESCHGPGQEHVAAARAGESAPGRIHGMKDWGATRVNELCGVCHRAAQDIDPNDEASTSQTQRFQPYGLMKSECFLKSGDRLSCVTCHEPHRDVETADAGYERTCRSCHGEAPQSVVCPVNPRTGCVGCHMPERELMPGIGMADHWIRVFAGTAERAVHGSSGASRTSTK